MLYWKFGEKYTYGFQIFCPKIIKKTNFFYVSAAILVKNIKKTLKPPFFVTSVLSVWTLSNGYLKFIFAGPFLYYISYKDNSKIIK